jgi:glycosyltransferase involved in cell wall biosynthesis
MDIAYNCRCIMNKNNTGIGRYLHNLINTLGQIDHDNAYHLYAKKSFFSFRKGKRLPKFDYKNIHLKVDRFGLGIDKIVGKVDIYHSPSPEPIRMQKATKVIVTVHDLIFKAFPQGHTEETIEETAKQFRQIVERASKIICCSENTKRDLMKYFPVPEDKIVRIYQGVDKNVFYVIGNEEEAFAQKLLKSKGVDEPYILCVGTIEGRKNVEGVLYAFHELRGKNQFKGKLVIIGMRGWLSEGIEDLIEKLELKNQVIIPGFLSDAELRCFYNKAEVFVFPSFYEGFGFPIIEAFCCGTPVVTSNVSSCPEVAGDAAFCVPPQHADEIAEAINHILQDKQLRQSLRERGFKRAGDFNFLKTAQKTLDVYKEVYASSR